MVVVPWLVRQHDLAMGHVRTRRQASPPSAVVHFGEMPAGDAVHVQLMHACMAHDPTHAEVAARVHCGSQERNAERRRTEPSRHPKPDPPPGSCARPIMAMASSLPHLAAPSPTPPLPHTSPQPSPCPLGVESTCMFPLLPGPLLPISIVSAPHRFAPCLPQRARTRMCGGGGGPLQEPPKKLLVAYEKDPAGTPVPRRAFCILQVAPRAAARACCCCTCGCSVRRSAWCLRGVRGDTSGSGCGASVLPHLRMETPLPMSLCHCLEAPARRLRPRLAMPGVPPASQLGHP